MKVLGVNRARSLNTIVLFGILALLSSAAKAVTVAEQCARSNHDNMPSVRIEEGGHPRAYTLSLYPDSAHRLQGLDEQLEAVQYASKELSARSFFEKARDESPSNLPKSTRLTWSDFVSQFGVESMVRAVLPYLCENPECREAAVEVLTLLEIKNLKTGAYVSFPKYLLEMANSVVYRRAMSALSIKILDKVEAAKRGDGKNLGSIFDDVKLSFTELGLTSSQAEEASWKIMAVYSGRGSSTEQYYRYMDVTNAPVLAALGVIGSALPYLDSITLQHGYLYSLPPGVSTSCDYSRTYHFWMGAAIGNELRKRGYSVKTSVEAMHALSLFYEKFASLGTKREYGAKKPESFSNGYVSETQKNIAFNDFGALWGHKGQIFAVDEVFAIDEGLRLMFASRNLEAEKADLKLSEHIFKIFGGAMGVNNDFFVWRAKFAPDAHMPVVLKLAN